MSRRCPDHSKKRGWQSIRSCGTLIKRVIRAKECFRCYRQCGELCGRAGGVGSRVYPQRGDVSSDRDGGGGTCVPTPGDFDLIIETQPANASEVMWIRYQLVGRHYTVRWHRKLPGGDPVAATSSAGIHGTVPDERNKSSDGANSRDKATYPTMFPGGPASAIISVLLRSGSGTVPCPTAGE